MPSCPPMGSKGTSPWLCAHTTGHHRPPLSPRDTPSSWGCVCVAVSATRDAAAEVLLPNASDYMTYSMTYWQSYGDRKQSCASRNGGEWGQGSGSKGTGQNCVIIRSGKGLFSPKPCISREAGSAGSSRGAQVTQGGRARPRAPIRKHPGAASAEEPCLLSDSPLGRTQGSWAF